jgi:hypothetical protein
MAIRQGPYERESLGVDIREWACPVPKRDAARERSWSFDAKGAVGGRSRRRLAG